MNQQIENDIKTMLANEGTKAVKGILYDIHVRYLQSELASKRKNDELTDKDIEELKELRRLKVKLTDFFITIGIYGELLPKA